MIDNVNSEGGESRSQLCARSIMENNEMWKTKYTNDYNLEWKGCFDIVVGG